MLGAHNLPMLISCAVYFHGG